MRQPIELRGIFFGKLRETLPIIPVASLDAFVVGQIENPDNNQKHTGRVVNVVNGFSDQPG